MCVLSRGCVAAGLLILLYAEFAEAQRPPKYVRTPYVEVYRDEFGGKHIRTPFAEIHKPGRIPPALIGPPVYAIPADPPQASIPQQSYRTARPTAAPRVVSQPTPAIDYSRMDAESLKQTLQTTTQRLENELSQVPGGASWSASLRTSDIAALADRPAPPSETARKQLAEIADVLDALQADPHASAVTNLPSYRNLRLAVHAYSASPGDRLRQQLLNSSAQLAHALERFDTAATWLRYFALTPGGTLTPGRSPEIAVADTAELVKLLSKFDSVTRNPAYSMIAELPEFQQTYQLLSEVIAEQPQSGQAPAEELPPPPASSPKLSPEV